MAFEIGSEAPGFDSVNDFGEPINLEQFKGNWVVLYFYPKDNTSGCTKEACSFRDNYERITSIGAVVLGVSPDGAKSHEKFKTKFELNCTMIAYTEKKICDLFNVIGEKSMYGKKYMGVIRSTFIIDPEGIIRFIFSNVKVDGHIDDVINKIIEAMVFGINSKEVADALSFFDQYINEHFSYEEDYMQRHSYADLDKHKIRHQDFRNK